MPSPELENLAKIGKLKRDMCSPQELDGLVASGTARLTDAANPDEGVLDVDERLLRDLMEAARTVLAGLRALPPLERK